MEDAFKVARGHLMALAISEEERRKRSERAKAMHRERHPDDPSRRRFGGPQPNSGPKRQKRATEVAAERIARHGNLMADAIIAAMRDDNPTVRLRGVQLGMELEHREAQLKMQEDRMDEERSDAELRKMLVEMAMKAVRSGAISASPQYDVESTAVDVEAA